MHTSVTCLGGRVCGSEGSHLHLYSLFYSFAEIASRRGREGRYKQLSAGLSVNRGIGSVGLTVAGAATLLFLR